MIPARWGSTRFPGKPLADLGGRPMVWHVWRRAKRAMVGGSISRLILATDDDRILRAGRAFGAEAWKTPAAASGTDRVAWVSRRLPFYGLVINIQGDEPFLPPGLIRRVIRTLGRRKEWDIATAVAPWRKTDRHPDHVAVEIGPDFTAVGFQRFSALRRMPRWRHIGIYAYRRNALLRLSRLPPTPSEKMNRLEQLRALENGFRIGCVRTSYDPICVDRPADLRRARRILSSARMR